MSIVMCRNCRKNCPSSAMACAACGWDLQGERDHAYDRALRFWASILTALCAVTFYLAVRSLGRQPSGNDYRDLIMYLIVSMGVMYSALKLLYPRSGRNMWVTALVPAMIIATGVFVTRAVRGQGSGIAAVQTAIATIAASTTQQAAQPAKAHNEAAFEPLRPMALECFAFVGKQPMAIVAEFDNAGFARILAPREMEDPKRLEASRARIKRLHARLNDYDARIRKSAAEVAVKVRASNAPAEVQAEFNTAVRDGGGDFVRQTLAFVALEHRALDKADELLALAQSRAGGYRVDGSGGGGANKLVFAEAADQKKHDALRREMDALTTLRDASVRRLRTQAQDAFAAINAVPAATARVSFLP
jgi:hypothetical protein